MRRIAFTLIELLVVIAVISLLMAILIPVLQSSRKQAKAVICSSNIKQLTVELFMYEEEKGSLPPAFVYTFMGPSPPGGYAGDARYDRPGWWWFNYIEGLYNTAEKKRTILICPSRHLRNSELKNNILCGNYGVNRSVCKSPSGRIKEKEFVGKPLRTTNIRNPGRTLLLVDSGYSMISWWHAADMPPYDLSSMIEDTAYVPGLKINEEKSLWSGQKQDAVDGRHHNKTVNVGFADGHIEQKKADELLVEKTGESYKNLRLLWQPE
ncbi:MAG: type II secretion system protein [Planctomycetota bacterium]|jgi:prepilin-type N-terminal cleavage/methylation domain-containing protein/prepilin-type processing-associated H-X9-DG protein